MGNLYPCIDNVGKIFNNLDMKEKFPKLLYLPFNRDKIGTKAVLRKEAEARSVLAER